MNPNQKRQAPPTPEPKISLEELDARFFKDMNNTALNPDACRLFAGRCHQLILHILRLQQAVSKLLQDQENTLRLSQQLQNVLEQLTAATAAANPAQQGADVGAELGPEATPAAADQVPLGPDQVPPFSPTRRPPSTAKGTTP